MGASTRDLHLPERITKDSMIRPTHSYTSSFPANSLILPSFRETIITLLYILFCLYLHCNLGKNKKINGFSLHDTLRPQLDKSWSLSCIF